MPLRIIHASQKLKYAGFFNYLLIEVLSVADLKQLVPLIEKIVPCREPLFVITLFGQ